MKTSHERCACLLIIWPKVTPFNVFNADKTENKQLSLHQQSPFIPFSEASGDQVAFRELDGRAVATGAPGWARANPVGAWSMARLLALARTKPVTRRAAPMNTSREIHCNM